MESENISSSCFLGLFWEVYEEGLVNSIWYVDVDFCSGFSVASCDCLWFFCEYLFFFRSLNSGGIEKEVRGYW